MSQDIGTQILPIFRNFLRFFGNFREILAKKWASAEVLIKNSIRKLFQSIGCPRISGDTVLNQLCRGKIDEDMLKNLYNRYSVQ